MLTLAFSYLLSILILLSIILIFGFAIPFATRKKKVWYDLKFESEIGENKWENVFSKYSGHDQDIASSVPYLIEDEKVGSINCNDLARDR